MYCVQCGSEQAEGAKFCNLCGAQLMPTTATPEASAPGRRFALLTDAPVFAANGRQLGVVPRGVELDLVEGETPDLFAVRMPDGVNGFVRKDAGVVVGAHQPAGPPSPPPDRTPVHQGYPYYAPGRPTIPLERRSQRRGINLWLALVVAVAVAAGGAWALSRDGGGSGEPRGVDPEGVAREALQAMMNGDESAYLELVRPDQVQYATADDLRGCDLSRTQVLVEEMSTSEARVVAVFDAPCGHDDPPFDDKEYARCHIELTKLSGRWYLNETSACTWL